MRKIHQVMTSSRAAIDLASIMVGIIIMGLIGGVIAATVFAVIPWSQDKAAKQQLESIHTAENAFFGLSSDTSVSLKNADGTVGSFRNVFTGSAVLDTNNLLGLDTAGNYCVVSTTDSKDYHAYSKSGSGKWFSATNSKKTPVEYTGSTPCVTATGTAVGPTGQTPGAVDAGVDNGTTDIPTSPVSPAPAVPAGPTYTLVTKYDFETPATTPGFSNEKTYGSVRVTTAPGTGHGTKSLNLTASGTVYTAAYVGAGSFTKGNTYRVTAYMYSSTVNGMNFSIGGKSSTISNTANTWVPMTVTFTATGNATLEAFGYSSNPDVYIDDITVDQIS
jgi:type II secretory pathway pseudopilin PulG